jgi:hypothetical protein
LPGAGTPPAHFRTQFHRVFDPPELVVQVIQRTPGVTEGHPGTGKSHDYARHFTLCRLVAMDGTIRTGGFVWPVGAFLEPLFSVLHQFRAFRAETGAFEINVMVVTIDTCHAHKRVVFSLQSAGDSAHDSIIVVFVIHLFDQNQQHRDYVYLIS